MTDSTPDPSHSGPPTKIYGKVGCPLAYAIRDFLHRNDVRPSVSGRGMTPIVDQAVRSDCKESQERTDVSFTPRHCDLKLRRFSKLQWRERRYSACYF
jgi:hypothetical protein